MISKIPRWAWFGSAALAFIAGCINAVGFLGFQHQGVTHLTGSTTLFGVALASGDFGAAAHIAAIIGSFVLGCVLSGVLIQDSTLRLGRRYGLALFIESILLFISVPLLFRNLGFGNYLASCAIGLQNGMVSAYSGTVIRTTHVSGMFTDLGIFLGHLMRGVPVNRQRIHICFLLIGSFIAGSAVGAFGFQRFTYATLYFPAALTGAVGFSYGVYRHLQKIKMEHEAL